MSGLKLVSPNDWVEIFVRLGLAIAVGSIIGWERQHERKPAGLRTHMMVSLGAALFVITSLQIAGPNASTDAHSRVVQGIVAGIGFLGAGEIFSKVHSNISTQSQAQAEEIKIQGLTSAAAIWVSAALGVAAAYGLWVTSIIGALFAFFILRVIKKVE